MTKNKPSPQASSDPKETTAIKSLIQSFFNAINASDTKALGTHFFPTANLTILRQDPPRNPTSTSSPLPTTTSPTQTPDTITPILRTTIESFIALIDEGQKHRPSGGPVLHEAPDLDATEVRVDGLFGMAWSPFTVTFDGVLHHYGVMVFTVGWDGEGKQWRIEGLTQSYRRTEGWEEKGRGSVL